jgi:exopolysaccharide biosynthesis polyprenyl glycosylphosphotransferase
VCADVGPATFGGNQVTTLDVAVDFDVTSDIYTLGDELRGRRLAQGRELGSPRARLRPVGGVSDVLALVVAISLASFTATGSGSAGVAATFERLLLCVPVLYFVLAASRQRLHRGLVVTLAQEIRDVVLPVAAGTLACMGAMQALAAASLLSAPPENALLVACVLGVGWVGVSRWLATVLTGRARRRVLVVGGGVVAARVASQLASAPAVEFLGFVDDDPTERTNWLGPLHDLSGLCSRHEVDHVVVAFSRSRPEEVVEALRPLQGRIPISVVPRLFDVTPTTAHAHDLVAGYPAVSVAPAAGPWQDIVKRALDVAGGTIGLLLSTPVLLVAVLGVRLSSPGPIFLRQVRVGRGGKEFTIWKFRTFTVTESVPPPEVLASGELVTGPFPKLKLDPRMTSFGRVLRRTSIDELPQLLNVVLGSMSLVGPRPLAPDFAWKFEPWALRRYEVKPGLTGLWQVSGRNDLTYEEMCRLDDLYATCGSIWLDLRILARTARAVISGRGCY